MKSPVNTFKKILFSARVVGRYQTLVWLLSRYGLLGGVGSLGLELGKRNVRWLNPKGINPNDYDEVFGRNLVVMFQKMGPTFIKLGQVLASRPDIVGEKIALELQVLFSRVKPIPIEKIKKILNQELGKKKVKESFQEIDKAPLGSASIGQTHFAKLTNGTPVVIKIQKPGVADLVKLDLALLEMVVTPASLIFPKLGLTEMLKDFKEATLREIDYREEAKNIERFQKNYRKLFAASDVIFPGYFPDLSTERVIVLEPMRGKPVANLKTGTRTAKQAAQKSLSAVFEQIFEHGFFHADPHGANLFFVEEEGRMGFIDLGLVGQLEPDDKKQFIKVLMAILRRDRKNLAHALFQLGQPSPQTQFADFDKAIQGLLDDVKATGIEKIKFDKLVHDLLATARKNHIYIPNRYVMMIRSCLIIEGVAKNLDPQISLMKVAMPVVAKGLLKTYNPFRK